MEEIIAILTLSLMFPLVFFTSIIFSGIDRKIHARMQKRIGPPMIQPLYDFIKLVYKERIVPMTASSGIFVSAAYIAAASAMLGASIPLASFLSRASFIGDIILILYLLVMTSLMVMIGGSSSGNPFGAIGFSRKMTMMIVYEVPMLLSVILLSIKAGFNLSYYDIIRVQAQAGACSALFSPSIALAAIIFMLCIPAAAGVVPFDIPEAKTEVAHGPLIEYGGPYLAFLKLSKDASSLTLSFLGFTLFLYLPAFYEGFQSLNVFIQLIACLIGALGVMLLTITLPRTIFARLKLRQAIKFYLGLWLLSFVSIGLLIMGF